MEITSELSTPSSSQSQSFTHFPNNRKMGVEIETSTLKVSLSGGANVYSGFLIKKKSDGCPLWSIEQDTTDTVFDDTEHSEFSHNIEFKTRGGLNSPQGFLEILRTMTNVLQEIHRKAQGNPYTIRISRLRSLIDDKNGEHYRIDKVFEYQKEFKVKSNLQGTVRPQITYQIQLSEIPLIFQRLSELKHKAVMFFLNSLNKTYVRLTPLSAALNETIKLNTNRVFEILNYFNEEFQPRLCDSSCEFSDNIKGFSYLFLFYWAYIFNNNTVEKNKEPGPKRFLAIMSRIPFSQMYDYGLSPTEQDVFKAFFGEIILNQGDTYKIAEYDDYSGLTVQSDLTLKKWYNSIVGKRADRTKKTKKMGDEKECKCYVDLLSPPPGLPGTYSMGLYHWRLTNSPLIEVRGYALVAQQGQVTLNNVEDFVKKECEWFSENLTRE